MASMAPISTCIQARIRPGSFDLAVPVPESPLFRFRPGAGGRVTVTSDSESTAGVLRVGTRARTPESPARRRRRRRGPPRLPV